MSKNVTKWIVEEVGKDGKVVFLGNYDTYEEARDAYNYLKEQHNDNTLTIQKSEKKLLIEG